MTSRVEEPIHKAIVAYLRATLPHGWLVHHSRNGGMSKAENGRAKAMGTIKGWPDIQIMGPRSEDDIASAWFIEVKAPGNVPDKQQRIVHDQLRDIGCKIGVARSIDDARALVGAWRLPSLDNAISARAV